MRIISFSTINAMRIWREPTQAFVQYRAWADSGYISVFNIYTPTPQKNPTKPSTLVFRVRSKPHESYVVITKSISKLSLNTCFKVLASPAVHMGSSLVFAHTPFPLWCWPSSINKDNSLGGEITVDGWECLKHHRCLHCAPLLYTKEDQSLSI